MSGDNRMADGAGGWEAIGVATAGMAIRSCCSNVPSGRHRLCP
jgi:hypothetical protein